MYKNKLKVYYFEILQKGLGTPPLEDAKKILHEKRIKIIARDIIFFTFSS